MAEYIDKEKFIQAMYQEAFVKDTNLQKWDSGCWIRYKLFEDVIGKFHAADVQPVVHGRWVTEADGCVVCSECGNTAEINGITGEFMESPYCSECGAKMDGEDDVR